MTRMPLPASMPNKPTIIIAAIAASAYVRLAIEAGFNVICMDAFADVDTQYLTPEWHQISLVDGQLSATEVLNVLDSLAFRGIAFSSIEGFCYGAGFEQQPELLAYVAERLPVLGNSAACVQRSKHPQDFFELCQALSIPHPPVQLTPPAQLDGWLMKQGGASGGAHVQWASQHKQSLHALTYYQQFQPGQPVSCLFLANQVGVQLLGFNEQWVSATEQTPFRLGGAVSHAALSEEVIASLTTYLQALSAALGLVGLNSCDAVWDGKQVWVLEINPRLSASMRLYRLLQGNLMQAHVSACKQPNVAVTVTVDTASSRAHQTLYAMQTLQIPARMEWPAWVSDIPSQGLQLDAGMPVITVSAGAASAAQAKTILFERVAAMTNTLTTIEYNQ